jgi:hypothetical protein
MIAMSKKTFMATIIITAFLISSVAGMQAVQVAKANPLPYYFTPNHDEPVLIVETPQNYTTYTVSSILLNFTVIRPSSWYTTMRTLFHMPAFGTISNITVSLNGNEKYYDEFPKDFVNGTSGWSKNYSICVGPLDLRLNTLEINVTAYTYYVSQDYYDKPGEPINQYPMNVKDTIYLNFPNASSSPTPSPSPSLTSSPILSSTPSPTLAPSPTISSSFSPTQQPTAEPIQTPDRLQVKDFSPIIIPGSMIFFAIIAAGLLVHFSKRRGKKQ